CPRAAPASAPHRFGDASSTWPSRRTNGPVDATPTASMRSGSTSAASQARPIIRSTWSATALASPEVAVGSLTRAANPSRDARLTATLVPPMSTQATIRPSASVSNGRCRGASLIPGSRRPGAGAARAPGHLSRGAAGARRSGAVGDDALGLGGLGLRDAQLQHAVLEAGFDLVGVEFLRQREDAPIARQADFRVRGLHALGNLQADLALDGQRPRLDLQVQSVLRHAGQVGEQRDARRVFDDVDRRQQRRIVPLAGALAGHGSGFAHGGVLLDYWTAMRRGCAVSRRCRLM